MTIPTGGAAAARYDAATALIVVDVQNDFADPKGALAVKGGEAIIGAINGEIRAAKAAGALIVYTQDWHPATTPHFARDGGIWPVHCVRDTWGAALHPNLLYLHPGGQVVRKGVHGEDGYSGFSVKDPKSGQQSATELQFILRKSGIARLVVCGLATDYCVKATALDGAKLGYPTRVLRDAIRAVNLNKGDSAKAIAEMRVAGVKIV
jgi:nicotinamidase/pyrazinamidase